MGFFYPTVDQMQCIHCNLCDSVCPIDKTLEPLKNQEAFACVNKDAKVLQSSTSGGAFSAIAEWIFAKNGVVYGCAYDHNMTPVEIRITNSADMIRLRGSKYVQCDTANSYISVANDLMKGMYVLYSGTPCMIAGLKAFLGKEYENLYCVDLVCHGVASANYFLNYLHWLEKQQNCTVQDFCFRDKNNNGWGLSGSYSATFANQKTKRTNVYYFNSYYYFYFLFGETYRQSCYSCKYAQLTRVGDFTLGDLWGVESMNIPFNTSAGCSLMLVNSIKAISLIKELKLFMCQIPLSYAVQNNAQLLHPTSYTPRRLDRINEYKNADYNEINRRFKINNWKKILIGRLKYAMPVSLKKLLLRIRYRSRKTITL